MISGKRNTYERRPCIVDLLINSIVNFHSKLLVSQRVNPINLYKSILVCGICGYWAEFEILLTFFRLLGARPVANITSRCTWLKETQPYHVWSEMGGCHQKTTPKKWGLHFGSPQYSVTRFWATRWEERQLERDRTAKPPNLAWDKDDPKRFAAVGSILTSHLEV
jgi:hypothetical protein